MSYSDFVNDIFDCIKKHSDRRDFSCSVFAEGPEKLKNRYGSTQENAVLKNEYARKFVSVIDNYSTFRKICGKDCVLTGNSYAAAAMIQKLRNNSDISEASVINTVRTSHSCYSKNLNRWRSGKTSRKISCRVQFCALAWCWYDSWTEELNPEVNKEELYNSFRSVCLKYTDSGEELSVKLLWKACSSAYSSGAAVG